MVKHRRSLCLIMLVTLLAGLIPCQKVEASNRDIVNNPPGDLTDYDVKGEPFDALADSITNDNFSINALNTSEVNVHVRTYASRLKGLSALASKGIDANDMVDYANAIAVSEDNNAFISAYPKTSVTIGASSVSTDLEDTVRARFLHRKDVELHAQNNKELYQALCYTVLEYIYYATEWRSNVNAIYNNKGKITSEDAKGLEELHDAYEWATNRNDANQGGLPNYSFIVDLWETAGGEGDLGLRELYELAQHPEVIDSTGTGVDIEPDYTQPLSDFYIVNSTNALTRVSWDELTSASGNVVVETAPDTDTTTFEQDTNATRSAVSLSDDIVKGIAYSAGYIPMQTNLYAPSTVNSYDHEWLSEFHYKYGFMRKALYKDTSATSAMDYYNSRGTQTGNLKVCTLRDFLELGDKDLTLYIDDDFYNSAEGEELVYGKRESSLKLLEDFIEDLQLYIDTQYGKDETLKDSTYADNSYILNLYGIDMLEFKDKRAATQYLTKLKKIQASYSKLDTWDAVVKDGDYTTYSSSTRNIVISSEGEYTDNADLVQQFELPYDVVMSSELIKDTLDGVTIREELQQGLIGTAYNVASAILTGYQYTTYDEYTPLLSFAYVSAIYRNEPAYKVSSLNELDSPVFIASDDVCQVKDATSYDRQSLLNYMLVRNLNSMVQINYTYSMDMDCPVYMDIYGNIVTQSGLVVIPAACNATLFPDDYPNFMYSAGLFMCYGNDWYVPTSYDYVDVVLSSYFYQDHDNGVWLIDGRGIDVEGTQIDFAQMSVYSASAFQKLQEAFESYVRSEGEDYTHVVWAKSINIINEVMRGAPLEHIDLVTEGIQTDGVVNKTSIVAAAKLESLIESLSSDTANSLLALPDFNSTEHSEYIVAFLLKLLMIATVTVVLFAIYRDAVGSNLGIRTIWKCLCAVGLTVVCATSIPMIFELTYYAANKTLLQKEVTKICMYNLEKSQSGIEIGVTKTDVPSTYNKLMVQLDWVDVPWYEEINELLFGRGLLAVSDAREKAMADSQLTYLNDTHFYNDGVYMSVDDIYNSVGMDFTFNVGENEGLDTAVEGLYLYDNGTNQTLSFYSPYYVFLKALTANVNQYNQTHNSYMYTTKLQSGNRLKTVGLCSNYFQSKGFMEQDEDILHLYEVYGLDKSAWYDNGYCFYDDEIELMSKSRWFNNMDSKGLSKRIEIVNTYCREFIADNRELLDKVTDETFIKVMALSCAMKYNQVFGISEANCFEIYDLDSNDLLRLSLASTDDAMLTSPMSFSRFVLTIGGEASVYAAAVLEMVMYIGSFVKPICILISYISVFMSIFVFRVVLRRKSNNLLGYVVTVGLLSFTNFLHAILLKLSTYLPEIGLPMVGCIIFIIVGQVSYLLFLGYVTGIALKDWYNLGANHYQESFEALKRRRNSKKGDYLAANVPRYKDNWDYYNALVEQHRERNY